MSTEEQNLDRQTNSTAEYADRIFDAGLSELEHYRDKSTGTNTACDGYRQMMADAEAGELDAVCE